MKSSRKNFSKDVLQKIYYRGSVTKDHSLWFQLKWKNVPGRCGFRTVEETQHHYYKKIVVKILLHKCIADAEVSLWPKLTHEKILLVIKVQKSLLPYIFIFYMRVYPTSLRQIIEDASFASNFNAFQRSMYWLYDVRKGIESLESPKLCHMHLKLGSWLTILIQR